MLRRLVENALCLVALGLCFFGVYSVGSMQVTPPEQLVFRWSIDRTIAEVKICQFVENKADVIRCLEHLETLPFYQTLKEEEKTGTEVFNKIAAAKALAEQLEAQDTRRETSDKLKKILQDIQSFQTEKQSHEGAVPAICMVSAMD